MVRGRIAVFFLMWSACVGDVADGDRNEERRDIGSQVLSKDPHWRDPSTPTIDPATAIGWLRGSLRAGEVLEQVRLTPLVESAHTLVEGVAQSTGDARLLVFDENGSASTKQELMQLEVEAHRARHGFLSHELHSRIATADSQAATAGTLRRTRRTVQARRRELASSPFSITTVIASSI